MNVREESHESEEASSTVIDSSIVAAHGVAADGASDDGADTQDIPCESDEATLLSLAQLAIDEVGAMLSDAASTAQDSVRTLTEHGASAELPSVESLLADLFGGSPESPTSAPAPDAAIAMTASAPEAGPASEPAPGTASGPEPPAPEATPVDSTSAAIDPAPCAEPSLDAIVESAIDAQPSETPTPGGAGEPLAQAATESGVSVPSSEPAAAAVAPTCPPTPAQRLSPREMLATTHVVALSLVARAARIAGAPLRAFSAPFAKLPPMVRTLVGVFGLTLIPWAPAFWWLGADLVARDRVRPLTTTELVALTESIHSQHASAASAGDHGAKKDDHGGAASKEKPKDDAHAKAPEKPKEKPKEKSSGGHH